MHNTMQAVTAGWHMQADCVLAAGLQQAVLATTLTLQAG